ncbi:hypothetical protein KJ969_00495 [Patescibacteria group bacterium]|nr:hypothetical protein [Patescibacteria group bacterium]MBU1922480.1 hypothetical protein [Patescibacteria group bacterium]
MRYSLLFGKTRKTAPHDEESANARLLTRAGFIEKMMAGAYAYLPLGFRVLNNIKRIVREEMDAIGGQELLMPALQSKEFWAETGRWEKLRDVMYQFKSRGKELGLATTHEEPIVHIVRQHISSYKDLPLYLYQVQDKFRNEPRAKAGLLRGREFSMKDLYSFHRTTEDLEDFYKKATEAYKKIFKRCGLDAIVTQASGGAFTTEFSHEFQVITASGEDTIYFCAACGWCQNKEIAKVKAGDKCPACGKKIAEKKSIEAGNIFKLGTKYSHDMKLMYTDDDGKRKEVIMGCYGIGPSRIMGAIAEVCHDDKGLVWPRAVAPFSAHILTINAKDDAMNSEIVAAASSIYDKLSKGGVEVLWDDRTEASAGEKLNDADLLGAPLRLIVSEKTLKDNAVEWKARHEDKASMVELRDIVKKVEAWVRE